MNLFALIAALLFSSTTAQAVVVNIDAQTNSGPTAANFVKVRLDPGAYAIYLIDSIYTAANFWGTVTGCNSAGFDCTMGWKVNYTVFLSGSRYTLGGLSTYSTPGAALAAGQSHSPFPRFEMSVPVDVFIGFLDDTPTADNSGGVSLRIDRFGPPPPIIPLPAGSLLLATAVGMLLSRRCRGLLSLPVQERRNRQSA